MNSPIARAGYSALMRAAQPLLRRRLARRAMAEPGYAFAVEERFGRYTQPAIESEAQRPLWIHAVSLGETRAAAVLLAALRARDPQLRVLLTHGTATGRAEGERLLQPGDRQAWLPWDTPGAVAHFLDHFRPRAGVLMETELWPNLAAACAARGVPLVLANARLSEKSLRGAERLSWLARPAYASLAAVYAQTDADAARFARLRAPVAGVLGNLKFDAEPDAALIAQGHAWRKALNRPVVLLASSREGEEAAFLEAIRRQVGATSEQFAIKNELTGFPTKLRPQWLIVPRHPQRFDDVAALVASRGFSVARRSVWSAAPEAADVWLGDSLGEMPLYYALADVALLGASFEPLGGQNLIEAAACGCPLVMGPHTHNFAEAASQSLTAGAAVRVPDLAAGVAAAVQIAADPARRAAMASASCAFAQAHRGAAARTADAVLALPGVRG